MENKEEKEQKHKPSGVVWLLSSVKQHMRGTEMHVRDGNMKAEGTFLEHSWHM